jgi:adenine-specific DNA glycosylase
LLKGGQALFGGLWGVPMTEGKPREALANAGLEARLKAKPISKIEHALSHRHLQVDVYTALAVSTTDAARGQLFDPTALGGVGVSSLTLKILRSAHMC